MSVGVTAILHLSAIVTVVDLDPPPPPEEQPKEPEPPPDFVIELEPDRGEAKERTEPVELVDAFPPPPDPARFEESLSPHPTERDERLPDATDGLGGPLVASSLPELEPIPAPLPGPVTATLTGRINRNSPVTLMALDSVASDDRVTSLFDRGTAVGVPTDLLVAGNGGTGLPGVGIGGVLSGAGDGPRSGLGLESIAMKEDLRADLRKDYIARIGRAVRRVREYPPAAEDQELEGRVGVEIIIGASGEIRSVTVRRSSGHPLLDEAAVRSIRSIGSFPEPPAALEWEDEPVRLTIVYELD